MNLARFTAGMLFLATAAAASNAGAAELKLIIVEAFKPALQELAPAFEAESKHKLKIEYGTPDAVAKKVAGDDDYDVVIIDKPRMNKLRLAATVVGGSMKDVVKQGADTYVAATPNTTQEPMPAVALINFLRSPKAAEVYKAKGMQQPG
jgi:ABC-type molybdate transport system substrate-binding protein